MAGRGSRATSQAAEHWHHRRLAYMGPIPTGAARPWLPRRQKHSPRVSLCGRTTRRRRVALGAAGRGPSGRIPSVSTPGTARAKGGLKANPLVNVGIGDPVGAGLVASYNRPGGNITGNSILGVETAGKR